MATLTAVLAASLFGSLHCAGMCGPLVAFAVGTANSRSAAARCGLQLAYHGARLAAYALLGATFGLLGSAIDMGGALTGVHRLAAVLAGGLMVAVGVVAVLRHSGVRWPALPRGGWLPRLVLLAQRAALGWGPLPRATVIGLLSALLPCGWLYAFAIVAAGTASPWWGSAILAAFWLGTVPVLAMLGLGVQTFRATWGRRVPLLTAVVLVVLGLLTLADRLSFPLDSLRAAGGEAARVDLRRQVEALGESPPACCQQQER